jgi:hypothetical protein
VLLLTVWDLVLRGLCCRRLLLLLLWLLLVLLLPGLLPQLCLLPLLQDGRQARCYQLPRRCRKPHIGVGACCRPSCQAAAR